uniref:Fibronectin type-II domain-containing protein n=1 Tax=Nothoprocta perdicaria TaxID=30464 RepID=A0A8C7EI43_NOTPE
TTSLGSLLQGFTTFSYGGSSGGQPCFFPFIYKERIFYTCTNENTPNGRFWCATTDNYDRDLRWSYCADMYPKGPCVFPFTYKGQTYSSCTTEGSSKGLLWCSLSSNYDTDPKWTYCQASEYGGNSNGGKCSYDSCIQNEMLPGKFWCATTSNYDQHKTWSLCSYTGRVAGPGHFSEQSCVFPFTYRGKQFHECTSLNEKNGKLWCSTTDNYDRDYKWNFCPS